MKQDAFRILTIANTVYARDGGEYLYWKQAFDAAMATAPDHHAMTDQEALDWVQSARDYAQEKRQAEHEAAWWSWDGC